MARIDETPGKPGTLQSVEGASVADASPRIARAPISINAVTENAARMEAAAKTTAPVSSNRLGGDVA